MNYKSIPLMALVSAVMGSMSVPALASMGNVGTSYGVMPLDIGSAQSLSMFNAQVSATYYNPAYLIQDSRGELTISALHADQELRAESPARDGDMVSDSPSQQVMIGMKTDLSAVFDHPLQFGFIAGVEEYGDELMAFSSRTSETGQFLQYGREPLFLNLGLGTKIWKGIDFGVSARVTLDAKAKLYANSNLAGETRYEEMSVDANPVLKGIVSLNMNYADTFCSSSCFLDGWESAISYRAKSNSGAEVDATIIVDQAIPDPGLGLTIATIDSFQPEIIAFGTQYKADKWRVGFTLEHQKWSELSDVLEKDTIRDQQGISPGLKTDFKDLVIPRIGGQLMFAKHYTATAGVSYEESPLDTTSNAELNYFDNDKIVVGLGLSANYERLGYVKLPIQFDLSYQYQNLKDRDFAVTPFGSNRPTELVTTDGDIHVVSGAVTFKF